MINVLIRASYLLAIIVSGWALKQVSFFHEKDFNLISKIVLKITLPAAVICSFSGKEIPINMLLLTALGFGFGGLYVFIAKQMNRRASKEQRAFYMMNLSGYNIGNFTMPFAQSILGPMAAVATSVFDTGNAIVCLGGSHCLAAMEQDGVRFSFKRLVRTVTKSTAFDTYIIMTVLTIMHFKLPDVVLDFVGIVANANTYLSMLMLGVGFKISGSKEQIGTIVRILSVRYSVALILGIVCFNFLPLPLEFRQAVTLAVFAPIGSAAAAFTAELKGDVGLASAINSISIVISFVCFLIVFALIL